MWRAPKLCVYDWSEWDGFVIRAAWPRARRIEAHFGENPADVADRIPRGAKFLLVHLDITDNSPFIAHPSEFVETCANRGVQVLNALSPDMRKRTIQSCCREFGLLSVAASAGGPADEKLIVKTDLNSGGEREQLLTAERKAQFGLTNVPGRMKGPTDYFVARAADVPADIWNDPTLVVERYIANTADRFYRVYAALNAVVLSEAYTNTAVKRIGGPIRRFNYWLWRNGERILGDSNIISQLPKNLLEIAGIFLHRFKLDYGAVDIVESEDGKFYVVDANKTPHWGDEKQPGLIEHLRKGFSEALKD